MKKIILGIIIAVLSSMLLQAQKLDTVLIKTSGQCMQCLERIEGMLVFEKGVKSTNYNIDTHIVEVVYKSNKTSTELLCKAISMVGYDANDVPANQEAYEKLPACCQKGGNVLCE